MDTSEGPAGTTFEGPAGTTFDRRRFLGAAGAAALAVGATQLATTGPATAQISTAQTGTAQTGTARTSRAQQTGRARAAAAFGPLNQINAGVLNVGYVEAGPADGRPVILLHGFPYDIHSFVEVAPLLAARGYRTIVPYMRGHGTTTFLSSRTPRDAQQSVMALDVLALMDTLKIERAVLAGYDLGSRSADIIAALWPQRCKALVSTTGYLITNPVANLEPAKPALEWAFWYQYYFSTARGEKGLTLYRHDLGELIWKFNSPTWNFSQATYDTTAAAFNNPDYVAVIIDNYRWRLDLVPADPRYAAIERKLDLAPSIAVPTITLDGKFDPFTPPGNGALYRAHFTGKYDHRTFDVGHNVPQEAPRAFAQAVLDADRL
jgi:pimeloyl-ACP methyl ester carboxylesterase